VKGSSANKKFGTEENLIVITESVIAQYAQAFASQPPRKDKQAHSLADPKKSVLDTLTFGVRLRVHRPIFACFRLAFSKK
jgi:hypothetical protein